MTKLKLPDLGDVIRKAASNGGPPVMVKLMTEPAFRIAFAAGMASYIEVLQEENLELLPKGSTSESYSAITKWLRKSDELNPTFKNMVEEAARDCGFDVSGADRARNEDHPAAGS